MVVEAEVIAVEALLRITVAVVAERRRITVGAVVVAPTAVAEAPRVAVVVMLPPAAATVAAIAKDV